MTRNAFFFDTYLAFPPGELLDLGEPDYLRLLFSRLCNRKAFCRVQRLGHTSDIRMSAPFPCLSTCVGVSVYRLAIEDTIKQR